MRNFTRWKDYLVLSKSEQVFEFLIQNQQLKLTIKSLETELQNSGQLSVSIQNMGKESVYDLYCELDMEKFIILFYKDRYLGSSNKKWKIDQLTPAAKLVQVFDLRMRKNYWKFNLDIKLFSPSSRFGFQEYLKTVELELQSRS